MPWHIGSSESCPASKPYAVIKDSDGSVAGCHPTKTKAAKQLAALYANEPGASMNVEELASIPPARLPFPVTRATASKVETRANDSGMPTMVGHFSTFNDFYEVDSMFEGHFLERVGSRAFDKTIAESRAQMKVLYDHGQDPQIGNKILGPIDVLRTDKTGPYSEVPLFDTSYNRDLAPGLEAGVYGSSFRFTVEKDVWDHSPTRSDANPDGIPERTITEARVFEFGPVTFPANPNATAGVRSTTDTFYARSRDPEAFETLLRSAQLARTPVRTGAADPSDEPPVDTPETEPPPPDTPRIEPPPEPPAPAIEDPTEKAGSSDSRSEPVPPNDESPESVAEVRAARPGRITELRALTDAFAREHPGRLSAELQAQWDGMNDELNNLEDDERADAERLRGIEQRARLDSHIDGGNTAVAIAPTPIRGGGYRPPLFNVPPVRVRDIYSEGEARRVSNDEDDYRQILRDNGMRITEAATFPNPNTDVQASTTRMAWLLDHHDTPDKELARRFMATGSPLYRRAFNKLVLSQPLTPEEQRGTALAVGVDATGGFAIPVVFDLTVIAIGSHTGAINPYRRVCRVVPIVGTDTWNALTATAVTATRTTEAAAAIEQGPTFAQPQYIVKRVQAQITYSMEVAQDRTDIASEMAVLIQEAKDNEEENQFAVGVGTTVFPLGVGPVNGTSGAYTSLTTSTSTTLLAADTDLVEAALPVRHRFNAQWFLNRSSIRRLQALETIGGKLFGAYSAGYPSVTLPANGSNIDISAYGNTGLRILGYPVNESPSLPTATTANIVIGTLLNPDSFVIVDRIGMSLQIIPFIFGASQGNLVTGQQALYALWRNDARPINVDGGRTLRYLT